MSFHRLSITEFDKNDKERPNDSDRPTCPEAETTDVAWSVCLSVYLSLCMSVCSLQCAKMVETVEILFLCGFTEVQDTMF